MGNGNLKHHIWRAPAVKDLTKAKEFPNLTLLEFKCSMHNTALLKHNKAIHIIKYNRH